MEAEAIGLFVCSVCQRRFKTLADRVCHYTAEHLFRLPVSPLGQGASLVPAGRSMDSVAVQNANGESVRSEEFGGPDGSGLVNVNPAQGQEKTDKAELEAVLENLWGGRREKCPQCDLSFWLPETRRKHLEIVHQNVLPILAHHEATADETVTTEEIGGADSAEVMANALNDKFFKIPGKMKLNNLIRNPKVNSNQGSKIVCFICATPFHNVVTLKTHFKTKYKFDDKTADTLISSYCDYDKDEVVIVNEVSNSNRLNEDGEGDPEELKKEEGKPVTNDQEMMDTWGQRAESGNTEETASAHSSDSRPVESEPRIDQNEDASNAAEVVEKSLEEDSIKPAEEERSKQDESVSEPTMEKKYGCPFCPKRYYYERGMNFHVKLKHPKQLRKICKQSTVPPQAIKRKRGRPPGSRKTPSDDTSSPRKHSRKTPSNDISSLSKQCTLCFENCPNEDALKDHLISYHKAGDDAVNLILTSYDGPPVLFRQVKQDFPLSMCLQKPEKAAAAACRDKNNNLATAKSSAQSSAETKTKKMKEKRNICDYCGKIFDLERILLRHRLIHTGEKPHKCKFCPSAFGRSDKLLLHYRRVHPRKFIGNLNGHQEKMRASKTVKPPKKSTSRVVQDDPTDCAKLQPENQNHPSARTSKAPSGTKVKETAIVRPSKRPQRLSNEQDCGKNDHSSDYDLEKKPLAKMSRDSYDCIYCDLTFNRVEKLKAHLRSIHTMDEDMIESTILFQFSC